MITSSRGSSRIFLSLPCRCDKLTSGLHIPARFLGEGFLDRQVVVLGMMGERFRWSSGHNIHGDDLNLYVSSCGHGWLPASTVRKWDFILGQSLAMAAVRVIHDEGAWM